MREVIAVVGQDIPLGRYGEHLATCVSFDISEWVNTYGEGVAQLLHRRNGDSIPYPCDITQEGGVVTWVITQSDVDVAGSGLAELNYFVNDALVKSERYDTVTERSLYRSGEEAPEPYKGWMDNMLKAGSDAVESAENAADSERKAKNALSGVQMAIQNIPEGDTPIVNDLTTGGATMALSAEMGVKLGDEIKSGNKVMNGVRRKVAALAGLAKVGLNELDAEIAKRRVTVVSADDELIKFQAATGNGFRQFTFRIGPETKATRYQVVQFSEYNIFNLFSSKSTDKTLVGLWIDGTLYDSVDVLKDTNLVFDNMMFLYAVNEGSYTINTCVCISADGIKVYESIPETVTTNPLIKTCLTGSASGTVTPLVQGEKFMIFTMVGGGRWFIHTVEDLGQTVVKNIAFNGRL